MCLPLTGDPQVREANVDRVRETQVTADFHILPSTVNRANDFGKSVNTSTV